MQNKIIHVLYINHSGLPGGMSFSLLSMIKAFPKNSVKAYLINQDGIIAKFFKNEGIPVITTAGISQFDNTQFGYYRKFRWLILLRELYYSFFTLFSIIKARLMWKEIDIIHINEITMVLPIVLSKLIFNKPIVVHCRSMQRKKKNYRFRLINFILKQFADIIVAIDLNVKDTIPINLDVKVIHNGFLTNSSTNSNYKNNNWNFSFPKRNITVGMVCNLIPAKGCYEFINAAKLCIEKGYNINFVIVGDNSRKTEGILGTFLKKLKFVYDVKSDLKNFICKYGIKDYVHLINFTLNVEKIYENLDISCFPSHLNACGRPVFEAAFSKVPSIVAITNPKEDTIIDGQTGICIEPKNSKSLANAIEYFYLNPIEIKRMGELAYKLAKKNFDIDKNAKQILEIYQKLLRK